MIGRAFHFGLGLPVDTAAAPRPPDFSGVIIGPNAPPEPGGGSGGTGPGGITGSGGATPGGTAAEGPASGSPGGGYFPNDICTTILGQGPVGQFICKGNFSFCSLLCRLAGQTDPDALNTCVQTYCPITFVLALVASGWIAYRLLVGRR